MPCIDDSSRWLARVAAGRSLGRCALAACLLSACAGPEREAPPAPVAVARPVPKAAAPLVAAGRALPPPATPKSLTQLRYQAAQRLVAANPDMTYTDEVPQPLLAIPVLEIELNADGSVRRVEVLRHPSQAKDTTQMAIDAVHRAAPFGDVSRLPKPWKFPETFLFRDDRRFKPRTLDS